METHIDELEKIPPIKVDMVSECEETKIEDEKKKLDQNI